MRQLVTSFAFAAGLATMACSAAHAAPVPGFEVFYQTAMATCSPRGAVPNPAACQTAINAYSAALIAAGVDVTIALASFTQLRSEVAAAGGGAAIAALFESLLPASGRIGPHDASPT